MSRRARLSGPGLWAIALVSSGGLACVSGTSGGSGEGNGEGSTGGSTPSGSGGANRGAGGATGTGGAGAGGASVDAGPGTASGGRTGAGGVTGSGGRGVGGAGGAISGTGGAPTTGTGGASTAGLPAFPGADGAGSRIRGGRGGTVYHVTRLDTDYSDVTPGTLRYGLTQLSGPRTIVFDVSGVISLGRAAVAGWDSNGNGWDTASRLDLPSDITIAGQTAPGPVIIMGGTVKPGGTNIILRNILFAPGYGNRSFNEPARVPAAGDFPDSYTYDALDISGQNLMIDHITAVYATDETVSMNELASNVTVQYSTIAQGQNYPQADAEATGVSYTGHSLGSLFQAGSNARVSILHNLYAHLKGRLPRVGTEAAALTVAGVGAYNDFRNNVFYNWMGTAGTGAAAQASQNNFVNNFYLAGNGGDNPVGGTSTALTTAAGGTAIFNGSDATLTKVFHAGNLKDTNRDGDAADGVALADADFTGSAIQGAAFTQAPYYGVTATATTAFSQVLDFAGARWWSRGAVDTRIVAETRAGTGRIVAWADDPFNASASEGTEWRALRATPLVTRPAGFDTDNDGMPNDWETAHGLDPNLADNNGDFDGDGYTNLEEYLNELAAWPAMASVIFRGHGTRYAEITNWGLDAGTDAAPRPGAAIWQPSRFDLAQIRRGTAVVDAPGQHAGTLQVAGAVTGDGVVARLKISDGWLEVADRLEIGAWSPSQTGARSARPSDPHDGARRPGAGEVEQTGGTLIARAAVVIGGPAQHHRPGHPPAFRLAGVRLVTAALLKTDAGGSFDFTGGTLQADRVGFDLVNRGGTIAPGPPGGPGRSQLSGNLTVARGTLAIDVEAGGAADQLIVAGTARLGGALAIAPRAGYRPRAGDSWTVLTAHAGILGTFDRVTPGYTASVLGDRVVVTFTGGLPGPIAHR